MNYKTLNYPNWSRFKAEIAQDICGNSSFPHERYIFRGQSNENWKLISTFDRIYTNINGNERIQVQNQLIHEFKKLCVNWDGLERINNYTDAQVMSVGQHYGLPTPLLDWTYSLYVAAFLAFCDTMNGATNVAIWIIDSEHEIWKGIYGVSIVTTHTEENERQKYQSGVFTLNQSVDRALDDYVETCASRQQPVDDALYKVVLPTSEWKDVLMDLDMMSINYFNLYRGLEGCARAAVLREVLKR